MTAVAFGYRVAPGNRQFDAAKAPIGERWSRIPRMFQPVRLRKIRSESSDQSNVRNREIRRTIGKRCNLIRVMAKMQTIRRDSDGAWQYEDAPLS
jgi:hypothetical protein